MLFVEYPIIQGIHLLPMTIHPCNLQHKMTNIQRPHRATRAHPWIYLSDEAQVPEDEHQVYYVDHQNLKYHRFEDKKADTLHDINLAINGQQHEHDIKNNRWNHEEADN